MYLFLFNHVYFTTSGLQADTVSVFRDTRFNMYFYCGPFLFFYFILDYFTWFNYLYFFRNWAADNILFFRLNYLIFSYYIKLVFSFLLSWRKITFTMLVLQAFLGILIFRKCRNCVADTMNSFSLQIELFHILFHM